MHLPRSIRPNKYPKIECQIWNKARLSPSLSFFLLRGEFERRNHQWTPFLLLERNFYRKTANNVKSWFVWDCMHSIHPNKDSFSDKFFRANCFVSNSWMQYYYYYEGSPLNMWYGLAPFPWKKIFMAPPKLWQFNLPLLFYFFFNEKRI